MNIDVAESIKLIIIIYRYLINTIFIIRKRICPNKKIRLFETHFRILISNLIIRKNKCVCILNHIDCVFMVVPIKIHTVTI